MRVFEAMFSERVRDSETERGGGDTQRGLVFPLPSLAQQGVRFDYCLGLSATVFPPFVTFTNFFSAVEADNQARKVG